MVETYIFQGTNLVVPESAPDAWFEEGIPQDVFRRAFEKLEYFEIPAAAGDGRLSCVTLDASHPLPQGWRTISLRQAVSLTGGDPGEALTGRLFRAYHIAQWRRESVFCGSCGALNTDAPAELARLCPSCGRLEFPRISPAIIVIITNSEDEILLAHNRKFTAGMYSLIAGFTEAGENLEATVVREVREEVGLEVRDICYRASQPWPFPNSLMLGFSARHAGGIIKPDGIEIEDAQWFRRDRLPDLPGSGSVSRYLINRWIQGNL